VSVVGALSAMLTLGQVAAGQGVQPAAATTQRAGTQSATQAAASRPAAQRGSPLKIVFEMDGFGRLRLDGRAVSLREVVQAASLAPEGSAAVLRYDAGVSDIQVGELVAALGQTGLAEVSAEPVIRSSSGAVGPLEEAGEEGEGLALLETLADLGRQLPSAIDATARSFRDRFRDISERAAAASKAAAGAARSLGSMTAATQAGASR